MLGTFNSKELVNCTAPTQRNSTITHPAGIQSAFNVQLSVSFKSDIYTKSRDCSCMPTEDLAQRQAHHTDKSVQSTFVITYVSIAMSSGLPQNSSRSNFSRGYCSFVTIHSYPSTQPPVLAPGLHPHSHLHPTILALDDHPSYHDINCADHG